jgi:hypothetical protein
LVGTGLLAAGVGIAIAQQVVRTTLRAQQRLSTLSTTVVEGWDAWFIGGFSGVTAGFSWLYAVGVFALWATAGLGLMGLGIRLITRF